MQRLDAKQLSQYLKQHGENVVLLDVREPQEYARCHIDGSLHIPMSEITSRLKEIDPHREIAVICHHGVRSMQVAMFLERSGFDKVINLEGGIDAWARTVDPSMATY